MKAKKSSELFAIGVGDLLNPVSTDATLTPESSKPLAGELLPNATSAAVDKPSRLSHTGARTRSQLHKTDEVVLGDVTRGMWANMCVMAAEGESVKDILKTFGVKQTVYRAIMRDDKACQEQMIAARAEWDNRHWPEELIEEICLRIAMGENQKDVADDLGFKFAGFQALLMRDQYVSDMFMRALQIQAAGFIDEAATIADDDSDDMGTDAKGGDKPNTAAVQRANLRVKHRQWVASKLLRKVYGDVQKIEADVNIKVDHAVRLDEARKRKERAYQERIRQDGSSE